jgi:polysaccharide biosynthesis transport protein
MDKLDSTLARDQDVNEGIYNMLLQKLETAKITQRLETSKQGTRYTIIDPPRLPLRPVKPSKPKVIILGFMLGAMSGAGLVFGREFMDHSFLDIDDAKSELDVPVLGAISRITTQEEVEREKIKTRSLIIASLAGGTLLIIITIIMSVLKK